MEAFQLSMMEMGMGPGSQDDDAAVYRSLSRDMAAFRLPDGPRQAVSAQATLAAHAVLADFRRQLLAWDFDEDAPRIDLTGLAPATVAALNQSLGQGEVSALVGAPLPARVRETAFAGLWRVELLDEDGELARDVLEAGPIPIAVQAAGVATGEETVPVGPAPPGAATSPALLQEILELAPRWRGGEPTHVINLTPLALTSADLDHLATTLGSGAVSLLSTGRGAVRVASTAVAHVWRVQHFDARDQLVLDTIEITELPEVALAAPEDIVDSIERLGDWLTLMLAEALPWT